MIADRELSQADVSASQPASLVVFSDDWGRHPSSCQHLVRQLLPKYKVLWVNTIGTRAPRPDFATVRRVKEKLVHWIRRNKAADGSGTVPFHGNLSVVNPRMWPWFGRRLDRRFNAWLLSRQLTPLIEALPRPVSAVTTLPVTADLPGLLPLDHWLYYCVDDFAVWPGLDGDTLRRMDRQMIQRADRIVAASEHLQHLIAEQGRTSGLLTHGVDLEHWIPNSAAAQPFRLSHAAGGPLVVFWGVVDRRLDTKMLTAVSRRMISGSILLVGPRQDPDDQILRLPNVHTIGPQPFAALPAIATAADVLIMPYADLPVTRAMQPLKMKEYIATGRPVVVSSLPAVRDWRDCMDVAVSADGFANAVIQRIESGLPAAQRLARTRLEHESWESKAGQFEKCLAVQSRTTTLETERKSAL